MAAPVEIKFACETPLASNIGMTGDMFKELIEKNSNGEIKVRIYHSGALGRAI